MNRAAGLGFSVLVAGLLTVAGATGFAGDSQAASSATSNDKATRALFQAVYANDLPKVQLSVGDGADVDARDRWGMTPTEIAIDRGNYRIAHFLVSIHNTRRSQEAATTPPAAPAAAAKAESTVPAVTAGRHPATATVPAAAAARHAPSVAVQPASAASPLPVPLAGPNPFDPATPAPGSQLSTATLSADAR
ncbi:MAG: ankyrin repeat domain-containing protein [Rhodospirillales bacterium]